MLEPILVPSATLTPCRCMMCGREHGEMLDLGVAIPYIGQMYICTTWCAPKLVALMEGTAQPDAPCSATKADGQPCGAKALSGHDVCVAHLKVQRQKEEEDALVGV